MNIVIFISGTGSNLKAIITYISKNQPHINIKAVVSNNPEAYGLEIAKLHNIETLVLPINSSDKQKDEYSLQLLDLVKPLNPDLIVLAGFMKILSPDFIEHFPNRIINIHPSLLPKYPGLNTHQKALANNDSEHGCSIHIVTNDLDAGPILAQAKCKIAIDDTVESLKIKVQKLEHELYPKAIVEYLAKLHEFY